MNRVDRLRKLEAARAEQTRYRVQWEDGTTTTESDIVRLLSLTMQSDKGGIVAIEPIHAPPYNVFERLAPWFLAQ